MSLIALTNDQRTAMENNTRFKSLVRWAIFNQANYWRGLDGESVPGNDRVRWAKSRSLSTGIIANPTSQDFDSWTRQFVINMKTQAVVDDVANPDPDALDFYDKVMDYMLANSKFDELADLTFNLRILKIEF